jgi:hypothetical protein
MLQDLWSMEVKKDTVIIIPFSFDNKELFITCYQIISGDKSLQKQPFTGLEFTQAQVNGFLLSEDVRSKVVNDMTYYFVPEQQTDTLIEAYKNKTYASVKISLKGLLRFFESDGFKKNGIYTIKDKKYHISKQLFEVFKNERQTFYNQYNRFDQWLAGRIHHAFFLPYIKQGNEIYFYLRVNMSGMYKSEIGIELDLLLTAINESTDNKQIAWSRLKNEFEKKHKYGYFLISKNIPVEGHFLDYEGNRLYLVPMSAYSGSGHAPFLAKEFNDGIVHEGALHVKNILYSTGDDFCKLRGLKISPDLLPLLKIFCANEEILKTFGASFIDKRDQKDSEKIREHVLFHKKWGDIQLILEPHKDIKQKMLWYDLCSLSKLESLAIISNEQFEAAREKNFFIELTEDQKQRLLGFGFRAVHLEEIIKAIQNKKDDAGTVIIKYTSTVPGKGNYLTDQKIIGKFLVKNLQMLIERGADFNALKNEQPKIECLNEEISPDIKSNLDEESKNLQQPSAVIPFDNQLNLPTKPTTNVLNIKNVDLLIIGSILMGYRCLKYKMVKSRLFFYT